MAPTYKQTYKRPASSYSKAQYSKKPRYSKVAKRPQKISTADAAWTLAKKGLALAKSIKKVINTEEKVYDANSSSLASPTGTISILFAPAQGDAFNQRDGDSVRPLNLQFKYYANNDGANATLNHAIRVIIFRALGERATTPVVADILEALTADSPQKYSTRDRYNILYDYTFPITPRDGGMAMRTGDVTLPLSGHTLFTPAAATIETGGIYLMTVGSQATTPPLVDWYSRVWFSDT